MGLTLVVIIKSLIFFSTISSKTQIFVHSWRLFCTAIVLWGHVFCLLSGDGRLSISQRLKMYYFYGKVDRGLHQTWNDQDLHATTCHSTTKDHTACPIYHTLMWFFPPRPTTISECSGLVRTMGPCAQIYWSQRRIVVSIRGTKRLALEGPAQQASEPQENELFFIIPIFNSSLVIE